MKTTWGLTTRGCWIGERFQPYISLTHINNFFSADQWAIIHWSLYTHPNIPSTNHSVSPVPLTNDRHTPHQRFEGLQHTLRPFALLIALRGLNTLSTLKIFTADIPFASLFNKTITKIHWMKYIVTTKSVYNNYSSILTLYQTIQTSAEIPWRKKNQ